MRACYFSSPAYHSSELELVALSSFVKSKLQH